MTWSRPRQRMLMQLQAIERARKSAAEAQLSESRSAVQDAQERSVTAREVVAEAEAMWSEHLGAPNYNVDLQLSLAQLLLAREQQLATTEQRRDDAERNLERHRTSWQQLEAGVKSGDAVLRRGRRFLAKRATEARDNEISDRTTWNWFCR